jgi:NDP-sugar pyrophosphorylase family protein
VSAADAKAEIAILAGGLATRLGERARALPKSMLRIGGRPFIAWQLERIAACGFERIVLCTSHFGTQIRDFVGDGAAFSLCVEYSEDGEKLLGTGGALAKALPRLAERFLVTYGDSYLPFDYRAPLSDLRAHPETEGCLAVHKNDGHWDDSNARVEGERVVEYEKGGAGFDYIDYGALALRNDVLARHSGALSSRGDAAFGLDALQSALAARGTLRALLVRERFYEVGSERGISDFEAYLRAATRAY